SDIIGRVRFGQLRRRPCHCRRLSRSAGDVASISTASSSENGGYCCDCFDLKRCVARLGNDLLTLHRLADGGELNLANLTEETLIDRFIIHRMLNVSMAKKKCNLIVFNYSGQQYAMSYKLSESSAPSVNWWLLLAPQQQPLMPAGNSLRQCGTVCGDGHASLWRSASALDLLKSAIGFPADNSTAATASFLAGKRPLRSARVLKRGRRLRGIWRRKLLLVTEDCLGYCSEDRRALSVSGVSVPLHRLAAAYLVPKERTDELRITSACLETNLAFKFATPDEACSWLALLNDLIMRQSKT
ncbi:hypothetical protein BOX15_Mlig025222g1, partial [Macrostomum lignano]